MESPESPAKSVAKRKRSKRQRPVPAAASSSSSSAEFSSSSDDDDMAANCLILLAQGRFDSPDVDNADDDVEIRHAESPPLPVPVPQKEKFGGSRKFTAGFYVYECKTCSKCFPSFQALGGHRASHKKPRLTTDEKKKPTAVLAAEPIKDPQPPLTAGRDINPCSQNYGASSSNSNFNSNNNNNNNKAVAVRVHECGVCGAEFGSGQALGGHMRRHRPLSASADAAESKKERGGAVLSLDLNLPAPSDDVDGRVPAFAESQFQQQQQQQQQLFSASALVDCHY